MRRVRVEKLLGLVLLNGGGHVADVVGVVVRDDRQVDLFDAAFSKESDKAVLRRARIDKHCLAFRRTNQHGIALTHVEKLDADAAASTF
jgi:hypothetical protein